MKFSTALIATIAAFITDSAVAVSLNELTANAQTETETDSTFRERRSYAQTETEREWTPRGWAQTETDSTIGGRPGWIAYAETERPRAGMEQEADIGLGFKAEQTDNPYGEDVEWRRA